MTSDDRFSDSRLIEYTLSRRSKVWQYYDTNQSNPTVATVKSKTSGYVKEAGTYKEWVSVYSNVVAYHIYAESADYARKASNPQTLKVCKIMSEFQVTKVDDLGVDRQYSIRWYGIPSYPVSIKFVIVPASLTGSVPSDLSGVSGGGGLS